MPIPVGLITTKHVTHHYSSISVHECYKIWNAYWERRTETNDRRMQELFTQDLPAKLPELADDSTIVNLTETSKSA
jgi:hypothetical protein